jgi:hypothetical protein
LTGVSRFDLMNARNKYPFLTQIVTKRNTKPATNQAYIKVHLPLSLKQQLQALAEQRSISLSSLLRLIATEYIKAKG